MIIIKILVSIIKILPITNPSQSSRVAPDLISEQHQNPHDHHEHPHNHQSSDPQIRMTIIKKQNPHNHQS